MSDRQGRATAVGRRVVYSVSAGSRAIDVESAVLRHIAAQPGLLRATPADIAEALGRDLAASSAEVEVALARLAGEGAIVCQARPEKAWRRPGVWLMPPPPVADAPTWDWLYNGRA